MFGWLSFDIRPYRDLGALISKFSLNAHGDDSPIVRIDDYLLYHPGDPVEKINGLSNRGLQKWCSLYLRQRPGDAHIVDHTADIWMTGCTLLCQQFHIFIAHI